MTTPSLVNGVMSRKAWICVEDTDPIDYCPPDSPHADTDCGWFVLVAEAALDNAPTYGFDIEGNITTGLAGYDHMDDNVWLSALDGSPGTYRLIRDSE